jgi:hypothetical protein
MKKEDNADDNLYNVSNYSDSDLFDMLDLTNPTDRELEAKILMNIDKYDSLSDPSAKHLKRFFEDVYKHFYDTGDEEEYDMTENITLSEGFTTGDEVELSGKSNRAEENQGSRGNNTTQTSNATAANPLQVSQLSQVKSVLNPLLKETQKRVIHLDSSYRDFENYPSSTNYLINLSEVLNNVVAIRLHSISVPYAWYNISNIYNANYFILTGVTPGVKGVYEFKFEVSPGTYSIDELMTALGDSIKTVAAKYPEVNFGTTSVKYNVITSKLELILDIKNVFTEPQFYMYFNYSTNAFDAIERNKSISGFIGFSDNVIPNRIAMPTPSGVDGVIVPVENTYTMNSIYSNFQYVYNATSAVYPIPSGFNPNSVFEVIVDSPAIKNASGGVITPAIPGNNYFTIINYEGPGNYVIGETEALNTVKISFIDVSGNYTRGTIMEAVNRSLLTNDKLTQNSVLQMFDISYNSVDLSGSKTTIAMQRFQLIYSLEPKSITYVENMKQIVLFPDESSFAYPLWTGGNSVFMFDSDTTFHQPNSIRGDISPINTRYVIDSSASLMLQCTKPHYTTSYTNFTYTFEKSSDAGYPDGYSMNDYIGVKNYTDQYLTSVINSTIQAIDISNGYVNPNIFYDVGSNKVRMQFDMLIQFDQTDYILDLSGCFLSDVKFINKQQIDISSSSMNVFDGSSNALSTQYIIDNSNNKMVVTPRSGQGNSMVDPYTLYFKNGTYRSAAALSSMANRAFCNIQGLADTDGVSLNGLNMTQTKLTYDMSGSNIVWTFTYVIINKMTDQDYKVVFADTKTTYVGITTGTSWKAYFGFNDTSYNLVSSNVNGYTSEIVSDNDVYVDQDAMITIDASNNTFLFSPYSDISGLYDPNNTSDITITLPPGQYGLYQLYNEVNNIMNASIETDGSFMYSYFDENGGEYTVFQININKVYSAKDYELIFFDEEKAVLEQVNNITSNSFQSITWDVTIGWLLGYRKYNRYMLMPTYINNYLYVISNKYTYDADTEIITLNGDTNLDLNIFKNLYLIVDDFTQNHLNDGLITGIRKNPNADRPSYSSRGTRVENPITGRYQSSIFNSIQPGMGMSEKQLYAANTIAEENQVYQTTMIYSDPPYVKDMFALIPLKVGSLSHGDYYTEYGGTLQDNDRKYFGPVNITKMNIKLLNDHGDVLDLNGGNWSFSIVFEYLYNFKGI